MCVEVLLVLAPSGLLLLSGNAVAEEEVDGSEDVFLSRVVPELPLLITAKKNSWSCKYQIMISMCVCMCVFWFNDANKPLSTARSHYLN
jgi:hypothetical protein